MFEWDLHARMNLFVVLRDRFDKAIPTLLTLLDLTCFLCLAFLNGIRSTISHVLAHESTMMSFAVLFGINLGSQEWNLSRLFHSFFNIIYNSMLVAFVVIENERCGIHRTTKLRLCLVHGAAAFMFPARSCSISHF